MLFIRDFVSSCAGPLKPRFWVFIESVRIGYCSATQMPHIPRVGERLPSLDEVRDTSEHPERGGEGPASRKETPHWVVLSEKGQAFMLLGEMQEFSAVVQHGVTDISNQKRINQCGVWKFTFQKRLGGCESRSREYLQP